MTLFSIRLADSSQNPYLNCLATFGIAASARGVQSIWPPGILDHLGLEHLQVVTDSAVLAAAKSLVSQVGPVTLGAALPHLQHWVAFSPSLIFLATIFHHKSVQSAVPDHLKDLMHLASSAAHP